MKSRVLSVGLASCFLSALAIFSLACAKVHRSEQETPQSQSPASAKLADGSEPEVARMMDQDPCQDDPYYCGGGDPKGPIVQGCSRIKRNCDARCSKMTASKKKACLAECKAEYKSCIEG